MSKLPAMPFFWDSWFTKTMHLSRVEKCAYFELLGHMWCRGGYVKDDDLFISKLLHMRIDTWRQVAKEVRPLLIAEDGRLTNARLQQEWQFVSAKRERNSAIRKQALEAKSLKNNDPIQRTLNERSTPTPTPTPTLKEERNARDALFSRFWEIWPNKVGRPAAVRAFVKVKETEIDAILTGVERYICDKPSDRPWLNPATFLNQRRWEDLPANVTPIRRAVAGDTYVPPSRDRGIVTVVRNTSGSDYE